VGFEVYLYAFLTWSIERFMVRFGVSPLGEVGVASRGQEIVSVASQSDRFKCISCVPGFQPQVYELRPTIRKEMYQLRPGFSTPSMKSSDPRLLRNCIICVPGFQLQA